MTTRHFCTYFDYSYLPRGMVMLESLRRHCPGAHIHVLCLSDECRSILQNLDYPHVSLISLKNIEAAVPELLAVRPTRSLIEYYFTLTPCLPLFLLTKREDIEEITYLDADMLFFSSPEPLFVEAGDAAVIITPHRFSAGLEHLEKYGKYNVSWMTFRNTGDGLACLAWYQKACLEWCKDELEPERFADQKYLDFFPREFAGVHVMRHAGGGMAPWNLADAVVKENRESPTVNDVPLIFYHAQGFRRILGPFFSSGLLQYGTGLQPPEKRRILALYAKLYEQAEKKVPRTSGKPQFSGIRSNNAGKRNMLRIGKQILKEWLRKALVVQF